MSKPRKPRAQITKPVHEEREDRALEKAASEEKSEHAETEPHGAPEVRKNPDPFETEVATSNVANHVIGDNHDQALQLAAALEEEKRARQSERKEKDALRKKMQEAEQEMNRLMKALDREKRETERQRLHYESRVKELEQRVVAAQAARRAPFSAEEESENLASSKATFRIDLYPHQGRFQGKIEHLLTHDKRAFGGIDHAAIGEFIAAHLPPLDTNAEELQKNLVLHAQKAQTMPAAKTSPPTHGPTLPSERPQFTASLPGMYFILAGKRARTNMLRFDQNFDVELEMKLSEKSGAEQAPWDCEVAIFAKRIEGGPRQNLGAICHQLSRTEAATALRVQSMHLNSPGIYRVEALVNVKSSAVPGNSYALNAHRLVQVY